MKFHSVYWIIILLGFVIPIHNIVYLLFFAFVKGDFLEKVHIHSPKQNNAVRRNMSTEETIC